MRLAWIGCLLVACGVRLGPGDTPTDTPTDTQPTWSNDTGSDFVRVDSALTGGSCDTVGSVWTFQTVGRDRVVASRPNPLGGVDRVLHHSGPLVLESGTEPRVPLGEDAWVVVRYGAAGQVVWAHSLEGTEQAAIRAMVPAADGGVFVGGSGDVLTTFAGEGPMGGAGQRDGWLARLSEEGEIVWLDRFGSTDDDEVERMLALPDGGILVQGQMGRAVTLGASTSDPLEVVSPSDEAVWLARYDADGTPRWARTIATETLLWLVGFAYRPDDDTVWLAGRTWFSELDFGPDSQTGPVVGGNGVGGFVAVYGGQGSLARVIPIDIGDEGDLGGFSLASEGWFATYSLGASANDDDGARWLGRHDGTGRGRARASIPVVGEGVVAAAPNRGVWVFGTFREELRFWRQDGPFLVMEPDGTHDAFVARYDDNAELVCAMHLVAEPGSGFWNLRAEARGEDLFLMGRVYGDVTVGGTPVISEGSDGDSLGFEVTVQWEDP